MRRFIVFVGVIYLIGLVSGCTVQKKKGEISTLGKVYHNTTALYNGYFNADVLMEESELSLVSQYQENYNRLLPVYPYTEAPNPKSVEGNLDKAIEKVSIVATIHEPSQWVDDCYVLMGKAQYLKQDYESAEKTFEFFAEEFDPLNQNRNRLKKASNNSTARKKITRKPTRQKTRPAKKKRTKKTNPRKKKKRVKPGSRKRPEKIESTAKKDTENNKETNTNTNSSSSENSSLTAKNPTNTNPQTVVSTAEKDGMFGHKPVYQEGLLWLARTYIHRERYSLADYYIQKVIGDPSTPKYIRRELPVVRAFYSLNKKEYDVAILSLEQAVELTNDKNLKARYTFIIAQLHQNSGRHEDAFEAYNQVIKLHPDYEMEFNAELNLSKAAWASGNESTETIIKRLEKMAKEEKNFEFRDQIYFTMGSIFLKLKNRDLAIENFRKSIQYNSGNSVQAAETYYVLANYFYEEEEYDNAKYHYDSTMTTLPETDERFFEVKRRSENLKEIAENISVIKLQDSLIRVSEMAPEKQREIAAAIKKKRDMAAKPKSNLNPKGARLNNAVPVSATSAVASARGKKSDFFAYDINKVRRGQNDFRKEWGSRILEDDWRRSNKVSGSFASNESQQAIARSMTDEEVQEILKDVPFTVKQKAEALSKIEEAYFNLGKLFRSKLEQYEKSVESLETLLERNSNSPFKMESYYHLYLSHTDLLNVSKAEYYKNKLIEEFPASKYTLSITDPLYAQRIMNEEKRVEKMYDEAYTVFQDGNYVIAKSLLTTLEGEKKEKIKELEAKIDLLKAMCDGNIDGQDAYITSLNFVVNKHPNTPEEVRAKEILRFIKGDKQAFDPILYDESMEDFKIDPQKLHYVLVVLYSDKSKDMTDAKIKISTFNQKYHKDEKLRISNIFLNKDDGSQLILVRKFRNMEKSMEYYDSIQANRGDFVNGDSEYDVFAVTQQSYREIIKQRSINIYRPFFEANYLKGSD